MNNIYLIYVVHFLGVVLLGMISIRKSFVMLMCSSFVFKLWCQSHKDAKGLRNKLFPHLEILLEIYAKDRANGNAAADPTDIEENILNNIDDTEDEDTVAGDGVDVSSTQGEHTPPTKEKNTTHKRHKSNDRFYYSMGEMAKSLKKFVESSHVNMEKMVEALAINHQSKQGKKVVAELQKIEGLEFDDFLDASNLFVGNTSNESLLFTLQGEQQKKMVLKLLAKARDSS